MKFSLGFGRAIGAGGLRLCALIAAGNVAEGKTHTDWQGYTRTHFTVGDRPAFVAAPAIAAPGKPWVWRTSFPDFHAEVDMELLHHGWHVGYLDAVDMLGCDAALELMDRFYDRVTGETWGLARRPALEAVSRGGLPAYRYAARHPERIACIYADTPVLDLKSWPWQWPQAKAQVADALHGYGWKSEAELVAFRGNPVDLLAPIAAAKVPLRHVISLDDAVVPAEHNTLEAQRRLRKLGHAMEVVQVAHGTAESFGHHFPLPAVSESAWFILRHSQVLPKGHEYFEMRGGLREFRRRIQTQPAARVVFLGGSITYNGGWRDEVMRYLTNRFRQTRFEFVAAGIPSLGSVPHAFRLERDVFAQGAPDLVFVEAAVNDGTNIPEAPDQMRRGMEGVIRGLRRRDSRLPIVQVHFPMPEHVAAYGRGEVPAPIAQHERVAAHYAIPSVNLTREVADRIAAGEMSWERDFRDVHPSPYGQQLCANAIGRLLDAAWPDERSGRPDPGLKRSMLPRRPLDAASYFLGRFGALAEVRLGQGFRRVDDWTPPIPRETRAGYVHVPALVGTTPGAEFAFEFSGTAAGLMIGAGPDTGILEVSVDGGPSRRIDTFTAWSRSLYLPWAVMLADGLPRGRHAVRVRLGAEHHADGVGTALHVFALLLN